MLVEYAYEAPEIASLLMDSDGVAAYLAEHEPAGVFIDTRSAGESDSGLNIDVSRQGCLFLAIDRATMLAGFRRGRHHLVSCDSKSIMVGMGHYSTGKRDGKIQDLITRIDNLLRYHTRDSTHRRRPRDRIKDRPYEQLRQHGYFVTIMDRNVFAGIPSQGWHTTNVYMNAQQMTFGNLAHELRE